MLAYSGVRPTLLLAGSRWLIVRKIQDLLPGQWAEEGTSSPGEARSGLLCMYVEGCEHLICTKDNIRKIPQQIFTVRYTELNLSLG